MWKDVPHLGRESLPSNMEPYIYLNHHDEEDLHISIDAFVLDTTNGLIELLIAMTDLNK
jgi:hypothetical protein